MIGNHNKKTWIDRGALRYLKNNFGCETIIDIGCGTKEQLKTALALGYTEAIGVDGDESVSPDILVDLNKNKIRTLKKFDLAWCIELLPYVEEKNLNNILPVFKNCRYIVATATTWPDGEFLNPNKRDWWLKKFESWGFEFDEENYKTVVDYSLMDRKLLYNGNYTWLERTGMFFKNPKLLKPKPTKKKLRQKKQLKEFNTGPETQQDIETQNDIQDGGEY
jgi:hypothetical protein